MDEKELQAELRRLLRDVGLVTSAISQVMNALQVLSDDASYLAEKLGMKPMMATPPVPAPSDQKPPGKKAPP